MSRIDDSLKRPLFQVNRLACLQAAEVIRGYHPPMSNESGQAFTPELSIALKLLTVAISHQINWEFLERRIQERSNLGNGLADKLASITAKEVSAWLEGYHKPEKIRGIERAALLRDVGTQLNISAGGSALSLLKASEFRLAGTGGFLERLDIFKAFREDPLRKKSQVLVHELVRGRRAEFQDPENILPAIDYHIIRIYLRSGRVIPLQSGSAAHLQGYPRPRQRLVTKLREAVAEALVTTAFYARLSVPDVNYIEWQLGRSVCVRGTPRCLSSEDASDLPGDVKVLASEGARCVFQSFCAAYADSDWRSLREPEFAKRFY